MDALSTTSLHLKSTIPEIYLHCRILINNLTCTVAVCTAQSFLLTISVTELVTATNAMSTPSYLHLENTHATLQIVSLVPIKVPVLLVGVAAEQRSDNSQHDLSFFLSLCGVVTFLPEGYVIKF
jgi:hypothetical protein